jgi:hypothetical protein
MLMGLEVVDFLQWLKWLTGAKCLLKRKTGFSEAFEEKLHFYE